MQALENFNWVDILLILLLLKTVYVGARRGLTAEFFKLIGTVLSLVLGLHNYNRIATALVEYINIPIWLSQFVILVIIVLLIRVIFKYIVLLLLKFLKIQFVLQLERIGGALVGLVRSFLIGGLLLLILSFLPIGYLYRSICERSCLAPYFINLTEKTYSSIIGLVPFAEPKKIRIYPPAKKAKPHLKSKQASPYSWSRIKPLSYKFLRDKNFRAIILSALHKRHATLTSIIYRYRIRLLCNKALIRSPTFYPAGLLIQ